MTETTLRFATTADAAELVAIYAPYVTETAITFEYDVPSVSEFSQRIEETQKRYPYIVAECDGRIIGYAYAGAFKSRAAYDWAVETSIYVERDDRGHGTGTLLYEALESILALQGITNVNACITYAEKEDEHVTHGSVNFHRKHDYHLVGRFSRCGYKFDTWYDMVWMEKFIGEHKVPMPEMKPIGEVMAEAVSILSSCRG